MRPSPWILGLLALFVVTVSAKFKSSDFTDAERWEATLQGISEAKEHMQSQEEKMAAAAAAAKVSSAQTAAKLLKKFFRKASAKAEAMGKARIMMEESVKRAERILLDKKRLQVARVASREELAEVLAQELYHKPGTLLQKKELAHVFQESNCEELRPEPECKMIPFYHSVRTITGVCNNLEHPMQGASFTAFSRLIHGQYANGVDSLFNQANLNGTGPFAPPSPSARLVSQTVVRDRQVNDSTFTHLIMQWGQFMDHDLDFTAEFQDVECNVTNCVQDSFCAPIRVVQDDPQFGLGTARNGQCHPFQRTVPACPENTFELGPREQVNELTHYMDGSNIYGSTVARLEFLRESEGGTLRVSPGIGSDKRNSLPLQPPCAPVEGPTGEIETPTECCPNGFSECFVAGDVRALEHVSLTVIHTIFVREHNRVARELQIVNPQWQNERLFIEARDIVIAQIQRITFNEYLPALFGRDNFDNFIGEYIRYIPQVDASIPNAFATAAYRFGHSQIQPEFARLDENFSPIPAGPLSLRDAFFNQSQFVLGGGVDPIVRGWLVTPARAVNEFMSSILTSQLFENGQPGLGLDLATLNVQRGRDHGLPRYGIWKRYCIDRLHIESDFRNELTRIRLLQLYGSEDNIDLFVGALAEEPLPGGVLGATLTCIFSITFSDLRSGDRFWHENQDLDLDIFTADQLEQIRKTSLSRILCDNTNVDSVQTNAFLLDDMELNSLPCDPILDLIPSIDFSPWREAPFCHYRARFSTNETTPFLLLNRVTGTGNSMLLSANPVFESGTKVSCVPIQCPTLQQTIDIITCPVRSRRAACDFKPRNRTTFLARVTVDNLNDDSGGIFDSLQECERSDELLVEYICDGAVPAAKNNLATTAELEKELAKVMQEDSAGNGGSFVDKLENFNVLTNPNADDILRDALDNFDDLLPATETVTQQNQKSTAAIDRENKDETNKLIGLLEATLQELKEKET